jgi:hypothetical protein
MIASVEVYQADSNCSGAVLIIDRQVPLAASRWLRHAQARAHKSGTFPARSCLRCGWVQDVINIFQFLLACV